MNALARAVCTGLVVVSLVALQCAEVFAASAERYGSEQLIRLPANRVAINVEINEFGPFLVMVDTATSHTILTPAARRAIGASAMPGQPVRVLTAAGSVVSNFYEIEVAAAGAIVPKIPAVEIALPPSLGISGILGADFLSNFTVELDLPGQVMNLFPLGTTPSVSGLRRVRGRLNGHGFVVMPGSVEQLRVNIVVDTGGQLTIANPAVAMGTGRLGKYSPAFTDSKVADIARIEQTASSEIFERIVLGPTTWRSRRVLISPLRVLNEIGLGDSPAVFIGMDLLSGRRIVFDYASGSVWIPAQSS